MSVLDVGCGNGKMVDFFRDKTISYTGVDVNHDFIQIAREKYDSERKEFYYGDMLALDDVNEISGKHYDVAFSLAALHHLPSERLRLEALRQMYARLAHGGTLFLTVWNLWRVTLQEKSIWKYALERSLLDPRSYTRDYGIDYRELSWRDLITTWKSGSLSAPLYYYTFRCRELTRLCAAAGFDVADCYYSFRGVRAHWWDGTNICLIARKK